MAGNSRRFFLLAVILGGGIAIAWWARRAPADPAPPALASTSTWIATAHQLGPVGYRDPAGAVSSDGRWLAYSEGRFLRVRAVEGGPIVELPPGEAQIRNLSWHPDSRTILADGYQTQTGWALYDRVDGTRRALWPGRDPLTATVGDRPETARVADLQRAVWSPDGSSIAAVVSGRDGQALWVVSADGSSVRAARVTPRIGFLAWTPRGEVACIATADGRSRVTIPCGGRAVRTDPDLDAYGPLAFAPDGATVYVSLANASGIVDLWAAPVGGGRARRLTSFSRDAYAPSVTTEGYVVFKVQSYRTHVALASADGGPSLPLATFQSETPSWDPTGRSIGITFGTWRRVIDDAHYPDIAQDAGIIGVDPERPAVAPSSVVHASASEDQSLCWSPNGKWIAFHSHKDQSDDIWLRPAMGDAPPRRVSMLGRGAETGWPRWSPDGKWVLFDGDNRRTHRSVMYVVGVDQESGAMTSEAREMSVRGLDIDVSHAEWLPDSAHVVVLGDEGPGREMIFTAARDGGEAHVVHRFASEHHASGLAVSPDGAHVAFVAPAPDGFFQVFRLPIGGGTPVQVTRDRTHKTQPAWSPDGRRIAFTVWNYDAQFWRLP
ncbi:MAG: PD40 domain-containing protein [Acidobacteria bacterium]|nr:PD40 domain-containing protein [Acidobacteriota bacterium]